MSMHMLLVCAQKDITEIELSHQKLMITGIEILLIFSVLLADTLAFTDILLARRRR